MSHPWLFSHVPSSMSSSSSSPTFPTTQREHSVHPAHLQAPSVDKLRHQESLWREDLQSGGNPRKTTPTQGTGDASEDMLHHIFSQFGPQQELVWRCPMLKSLDCTPQLLTSMFSTSLMWLQASASAGRLNRRQRHRPSDDRAVSGLLQRHASRLRQNSRWVIMWWSGTKHGGTIIP